MGSVISVINQKGGVGKTTTALNVGISFTRKGYKVLFVDLDPQGNLTQSLTYGDKECFDFPFTILDILSQDDPSIPLKSITKTGYKNADLIPYHEGTVLFFEGKLDVVRPAEILRKRINSELTSIYDVILLDLPPSNLSYLAWNALLVSDYYLIPVQASSRWALNGILKLQKTIEAIKSETGHEIELLGVALTRYDSRTMICDIIKNSCIETFGDKVFETVIRNNTTIEKSEAMFRPVFSVSKNSYGARDYTALTVEILNRLGLKKGALNEQTA